MTVWEFRKLVRFSREWMARGCCPLGAACAGKGTRGPTNPTPTAAERLLRIRWGYALAVIAGFDDSAPPTLLPGSPEFDAGERYGRRMRRVAVLREWRRGP